MQLRPIRALPALEGPISHTLVHQKTGALLTATAQTLVLWTVNGILVACTPKHTPTPRNRTPQVLPRITALAYSLGHEWDEDNVYITGHADGSVKFWSVRMLDEKTETVQGEPTRAMRHRATLSLSTAPITTIQVDLETGQGMWAADSRGEAFSATLTGSASTAAVGFNAIQT